MSTQCTESDLKVLEVLADYRILTAPQAAFILARNAAALRRRLAELADQNIVDVLQVPASKNRGRPSNLYTVGSKGHQLLIEHGSLPKTCGFERVGEAGILRQAGHKLLLNVARIHLLYAVRQVAELSMQFFAADSPRIFNADVDGRIPGGIRSEIPGDDEWVLFPDAVIALTDTSCRKTVLFFLEVDMGTEPIVRKDRAGADIVGKIQRYQSCFRAGSYKAYDRVLNVELNGFRVLFLTSSEARLLELCRVVRALPPSQFIWAATRDRMMARGISGNIWALGGRHDQERHSIFGRFALDAPTPEDIA